MHVREAVTGSLSGSILCVSSTTSSAAVANVAKTTASKLAAANNETAVKRRTYKASQAQLFGLPKTYCVLFQDSIAMSICAGCSWMHENALREIFQHSRSTFTRPKAGRGALLLRLTAGMVAKQKGCNTDTRAFLASCRMQQFDRGVVRPAILQLL